MTPEQRHALRSLHLQFAPAADDLWHSQGAFHVPGVNDRALESVMDAFADAERSQDSSPLGVVVQGSAGSGKTHLLGQARERVQAAGGFFFLIPLLNAAGFWESARIGILDSLGRPAVKQETQLKELLWRLTGVAHDGPGDIGRAERRAIIGEDELTPEVLSTFVVALNKVHPQVLKTTHNTLRALVLLGVSDLGVQDIGQAFLSSTDDIDRADLKTWGISGKPPSTAQECVRNISRLVALAGPAVLAIDQFDGLLAQSADRATGSATTTDNRDLEHVAGGMMAIREDMRRTAEVVACLPASWEAIRSRAVASVADRFRLAPPLEGLPSADIGRAILERRFTASYRAVEFTPDYPSWPIKVEAFDDAPEFTPRGLLQRADAHIRSCVDRNIVEELADLKDDIKQPGPADPDDLEDLDLVFADYRDRAVVDAVLDHEAEDSTVPGLLSAALQAWIIENGDDQQLFWSDPPPGKRPPIHARLRQSIDVATDDERHWGFRAIASDNAIAVQSRIKNACAATGFGGKLDKRKLVFLRNDAWPRGVKTAAVVAAFEAAGGRTVPISNAELRTVIALRDFLDDDHPDLRSWLVSRRPAHHLHFMRAALLNGVDVPPAVDPKTTPGSETKPRISDPAHVTDPPTPPKPRVDDREHSPTAVPLGIDDATEQLLDVELLALRKHTAIFAGSGSGKTVLIRRLVEECALRGVSSIVLDPNNDLARLGLAWPDPPNGWNPADTVRADDYHANTEVVVWTPRRAGGRPLSFQPLPDFASVVDDADEYEVAVESAFAALEPRALISGKTAKAEYARAVLREALNWYGRQPSTSLDGFIELLGDLPDGISAIAGADELAAVLGQNLRAAKVNDPMFGGGGTPVDPGLLMTPSDGYRARVSVISLIGLSNDEQRAGFVNQLQMALFAWIKRNPAGDKPLGGLLVMDEAQNFAPSVGTTAATKSTRALSSQARKYGLGLVFATQAPRGIDNNIPGNAATQFYGLLNSSTQITVAKEFARVKGGHVPEISKLRAGNFYAALEGTPFQKITTPWCLSYHPHSPLTTEEVLELARRPLSPKP
jgi:hypothetical protein